MERNMGNDIKLVKENVVIVVTEVIKVLVKNVKCQQNSEKAVKFC